MCRSVGTYRYALTTKLLSLQPLRDRSVSDLTMKSSLFRRYLILQNHIVVTLNMDWVVQFLLKLGSSSIFRTAISDVVFHGGHQINFVLSIMQKNVDVTIIFNDCVILYALLSR